MLIECGCHRLPSVNADKNGFYLRCWYPCHPRSIKSHVSFKLSRAKLFIWMKIYLFFIIKTRSYKNNKNEAPTPIPSSTTQIRPGL